MSGVLGALFHGSLRIAASWVRKYIINIILYYYFTIFITIITVPYCWYHLHLKPPYDHRCMNKLIFIILLESLRNITEESLRSGGVCDLFGSYMGNTRDHLYLGQKTNYFYHYYIGNQIFPS